MGVAERLVSLSVTAGSVKLLLTVRYESAADAAAGRSVLAQKVVLLADASVFFSTPALSVFVESIDLAPTTVDAGADPYAGRGGATGGAAIVGGVVGGVAAVCLVAIVIILSRRRLRERRHKNTAQQGGGFGGEGAITVTVGTPKERKQRQQDVGDSSVEQQQQQARIADVLNEPLEVEMGPITGVMKCVRLSLMDAAAASGVEDIDSHAFMASEAGALLAASDPHGLDADEAGALRLYTMESELYPTLNRLLRSRERQAIKVFFPYLQLLLTARQKLPKCVGSVWRGVKGVDLRAQYPKGKELYWWAFSSTTKELSTLQNDMFLGTTDVRTVFMLEVLNGVDIDRYSAFQGSASEAEVLLYPGTKLKVVDTMDMGGGLFQVHLKEVEVPIQLIK